MFWKDLPALQQYIGPGPDNNDPNNNIEDEGSRTGVESSTGRAIGCNVEMSNNLLLQAFDLTHLDSQLTDNSCRTGVSSAPIHTAVIAAS